MHLTNHKIAWNPRVLLFMCKTKLDEMDSMIAAKFNLTTHPTKDGRWNQSARTCSTVPLLQHLAAKTTLSFVMIDSHDSHHDPTSGLGGQSLHHHCIIRNSEIVRYAKTFVSRSFFILQFALICALSIPCPWTSSFKDGPAVIHIYDGGRRLLVIKWKFTA